MPKGKSKNSKQEKEAKISPVQASMFFAKTQVDAEFNEAFETAKDEAIQKYMGMNGGMMPMGPDLSAIIQQIMMQMMSQKMNGGGGGGGGMPPMGGGDSGGNGYQNNASDVLDFESIMHNASEDFDFEEEGTDNAGPDDFGIRKGSKGDHPVDKTVGTPATSDNSSDDDKKIIDSSGDPVERSVMQATSTVKNAIGKLPKGTQDQVQEAFSAILTTLDAVSKHAIQQGNALKNLNDAAIEAQKSAKLTKYQSFLEQQFREGNAAVNSKEKIKNHLELLLEMSESQANKYMKNLADTPSLAPQRGHVSRFSKDDLIGPEGTEKGVKEQVKEEWEQSGLKNFVDQNAFALANLWGDIEQ